MLFGLRLTSWKVSFADNIHSTGSEILSTPELSDSVSPSARAEEFVLLIFKKESPLSGSRGSQSPSVAGLDVRALLGRTYRKLANMYKGICIHWR
jgi:hypothetical protein